MVSSLEGGKPCLPLEHNVDINGTKPTLWHDRGLATLTRSLGAQMKAHGSASVMPRRFDLPFLIQLNYGPMPLRRYAREFI